MATSRKKSSTTSAKSAATSTSAPTESVALPTVDSVSAIGAARHVGEHLADGKTHARFASLPKTEFDVRVLDTYAGLVDAADEAANAYAAAAATDSDALVPLALVQRGIEVKTRMLACVDHNLDDQDDAVRRADAIRPGTGHLDLVKDLGALASLYADYKTSLEKDGNKYRSTDAADAGAIGSQIQLALVAGQRAATKTAGRKWAAAFAKLRGAHEEIIAAGRWLDRKSDDVIARWPSLFMALRAPSKKPKKTATPAPAKTTGQEVGNG